MAEKDVLKDIIEIELPDGSKAFLIDDPDEVKALREVAQDRIWLKETQKRMKRISIVVGSVFATLAFIASQWPWILSLLKLIVKDAP